MLPHLPEPEPVVAFRGESPRSLSRHVRAPRLGLPPQAKLTAKYFSPERAPTGSKVLFMATSALVETWLVAKDGPPDHSCSDANPTPIFTGLQGYPPAFSQHCLGRWHGNGLHQNFIPFVRVHPIIGREDPNADLPNAAPAVPASREARRRRRRSTLDLTSDISREGIPAGNAFSPEPAQIPQWEPLAWLHAGDSSTDEGSSCALIGGREGWLRRGATWPKIGGGGGRSGGEDVDRVAAPAASPLSPLPPELFSATKFSAALRRAALPLGRKRLSLAEGPSSSVVVSYRPSY